MELDLITVATAAGTSLVANGVLSAPVQTINDIWMGVIGHRIAAWSESRKNKAFENYQLLSKDVVDNLRKVPYELITDPDVSVVGPALDAAQYYCDEDELRSMFAKIIAGNMNTQMKSKVHHSFVEIVKQLSPYDATLVKSLGSGYLPLANISLTFNNQSSVLLFNNFYLRHQDDDFNQNSVSISNLFRLGIITSPGQFNSLTDKKHYEIYRNSSLLNHFVSQYPIGSIIDNNVIKSVHLDEMYFFLTPYGSKFLDVVR